MPNFILSAFADEAADSLSGQINALRQNGISHLEIRNIDGKNVIAYPDEALFSMREQLNAAGVAVWAIGSPLGKASLSSDFSGQLAQMRRALRAAEILGAKHLRLFSFYPPEGAAPDGMWEEVQRRLAAFCDMAAPFGVTCCHENEKGIYGDIFPRVEKIHQALPNLKAVFDPANYIQCRQKPETFFERLLPHVSYLHIKDACQNDASVVPAGLGDGHIKQLIALFAQKGPNQVASIEPHLSVFSGLKALQADPLVSKHTYPSRQAAFDAAVFAFKKILEEGGYSYE